jgi:hypothetical protein
VSQVVYDLNAAKNLVSDYRYECESRGLAPLPIVFTFSVCGSMKSPSVAKRSKPPRTSHLRAQSRYLRA